MAASAESPVQILSGQQLLQDFRVASDIATEIGNFESWILTGDVLNDTVYQVQNNPAAAEAIAVGGLGALLSSKEERVRAIDLVDDYRRLDLGKYIGHKVKVSGRSNHIIGIASSDEPFMPFPLPASMKPVKRRTSKLTSFWPADQLFSVGEDRLTLCYWNILPFDKISGQPAVEVEFKQ